MVSEATKDVIRGLLVLDPNQRFTCKQVLTRLTAIVSGPVVENPQVSLRCNKLLSVKHLQGISDAGNFENPDAEDSPIKTVHCISTISMFTCFCILNTLLLCIFFFFLSFIFIQYTMWTTDGSSGSSHFSMAVVSVEDPGTASVVVEEIKACGLETAELITFAI